VQKSSDISKLMGCPHGQGGQTRANILQTRGEGPIFSDFVRASFREPLDTVRPFRSRTSHSWKCK